RPFIQNLDELPYPAYHLLPIEKYRPGKSIFGKKILPIITSRGCPFQCSFCVTSRMVGKRFRARSPKSVVDELEWLKNEHGAEAFCFYDDALTLDRKRILEICEKIKKRKIGIPWDCQSRADNVSREIFGKMVDAGCQLVNFGVESGSPQLLKVMGKGTTVEQNEKAIRWAKEAGLLVATSMVIGYPGETIETLKETLDFLYRVKPDVVYLCNATPYPGTALYDLIKDLGWKMSEDWSKYDTVDFAFENPSLPKEHVEKIRKEFYNRLYSPLYILRHFYKNNFYSGVLARTAVSHHLWRIKSSF
ncbi:MAG: radical SAM protein, partial [Candidatus Bathyarchaeota archaeon]|nr:radical SAM protein [Candidatus Bathyarchaeota archaeon]